MLISKIVKILVPLNSYTIKNKDLIEQQNVKLTLVHTTKWTEEIISEHDIIFPFNDRENLQCHSDFNVTDKFFISSEKTLKLCNDKMLLNNFIIQNNFDCVPEMNTTQMPFIIKPIIGAGSMGVRVISEERDFIIRDDEFTQAYEMGDYEYSTNVIFTDKILYTKTNRIDYSEYKKDFKKNNKDMQKDGLLHDVETPYQIIDFINRLFPLLKYKGIANINYSIVNDKLVFFEINPRISDSALINLPGIFKVIGERC